MDTGEAPQEVSCTILFVDIVGSTRLYDTLGDHEGQRIVGAALDRLSDLATAGGGTVIKTIGDAVMCTFENPNDATRCAQAMHQGLAQLSARPDIPVELSGRVGLQHGHVIEKEGDVFGDAVNVAARVVALSQPRQILTTRETVELLDPEHKERAHLVDRRAVAGKQGEQEIYELVRENEQLTMVGSGEELRAALDARMILRHGSQTITVGLTNADVTLGRTDLNDICIDHHRTSRWHAHVTCKRGKFFVKDTSSNGTFVAEEGRDPVQVRREDHPLRGCGLLGLGSVVTADSPTAIHYEVLRSTAPESG